MTIARRIGIPRLIAALAIVALCGGILAGITGKASAQVATPVAGDGPATVSVNGHGSVLVPPDTASVVVGIDVLRETLSEAQTEATTQMTAVIDALKAAGVAEDDIQTVNYSVNILRDYDPQTGSPGPVTGFQVSNQVNVTVRNIDELGALLDTVVGQGANSIYGISFYVADPTEAASAARKLAVDDATAKARELAEAAGITLGRVVHISEGFTQPPMPLVYRESAAMDAAGSAVPIQTGSSEIAVDVQMTFELVG